MINVGASFLVTAWKWVKERPRESRRRRIIEEHYQRYYGDRKCGKRECFRNAQWTYRNECGEEFQFCDLCVKKYMSDQGLFP